MTTLRDGLQRLAQQTEWRIEGAFQRYEAGTLDKEAFVAVAATLLLRARARGVTLADIAVSVDATRALGQIAAPLGLAVPDGEGERLHRAVRTVLDQQVETPKTPEEMSESRRARLKRLARDSAAEATVWATNLAMGGQGATGWVRMTDPDPCPVCQSLADGVIRSPLVMMKRHTGCMCVPQPVI